MLIPSQPEAMKAMLCCIDRTPNRLDRGHRGLVLRILGATLAIATTSRAGLKVAAPGVLDQPDPFTFRSLPNVVPPTLAGMARNTETAPIRHDFPPERDAEPTDLDEVVRPATLVAARIPAEAADGPVLIPALPAWAVGGLSMLVFAPLMGSPAAPPAASSVAPSGPIPLRRQGTERAAS